MIGEIITTLTGLLAIVCAVLSINLFTLWRRHQRAKRALDRVRRERDEARNDVWAMSRRQS